MRAIVTSCKKSGVQDAFRFARINNRSRMRGIVTTSGNTSVIQGVARFIRINKHSRMRAIVASCKKSGIQDAFRFARINNHSRMKDTPCLSPLSMVGLAWMHP